MRDSLTQREWQITERVADGLTAEQIASRLHITVNTVNTHVRHINAKIPESVSGTRSARIQKLYAVCAGASTERL